VVLASKIQPIPQKFIFKDGRNSTMRAASVKSVKLAGNLNDKNSATNWLQMFRFHFMKRQEKFLGH